MKDLFKGYYQPDSAQFDELWQKCIFILDTNILLNLYRYPKKATTEWINILRAISDRLWIPHQVALEYQERRLTVIAEQVRRFDEVIGAFNDFSEKLKKQIDGLQLKERHSSIDSDALLGKIDSAVTEVVATLETQKLKQPDIYANDELRNEIDFLLSGKIGPAPISQNEIDSLHEEGQKRFDILRPPGYIDGREKPQEDAILFRGLSIKRKFGDFILWKQLLREASERPIKHIILITDDRKEDWWHVHGKQGLKQTIGPRPELIQEITEEAGVEIFYMYKPDRFMTWANKYFPQLNLSQESITQVQEISQVILQSPAKPAPLSPSEAAYKLVGGWIWAKHVADKIIYSSNDHRSVVVSKDEILIGYSMLYLRPNMAIPYLMASHILSVYKSHLQLRVNKGVFIFIFENMQWIQTAIQEVASYNDRYPAGFSAIFGTIVNMPDDIFTEILPFFNVITEISVGKYLP